MAAANRETYFRAVEAILTPTDLQNRLIADYRDHYTRMEREAFDAVLREDPTNYQRITNQTQMNQLIEHIQATSLVG